MAATSTGRCVRLSLMFGVSADATAVLLTWPDRAMSAQINEYALQGGKLSSVLEVRTNPSDPLGELPAMLGDYEVLEDGLRFTPRFPFRTGVSYKARFDARPLPFDKDLKSLTLDFSLPEARSAALPKVDRIYPSDNTLPENLLRFHVRFSRPMSRGRAESEIILLGPDGEPVADALYRAPVELWDRSMRHLTVLLDPGRLKTGLGPNRTLGPPLKAGKDYTLVVGTGITDDRGNLLGEPLRKQFRVGAAIREPIETAQWYIRLPVAASRAPLIIDFPRPLDWALLLQCICVLRADGEPVEGTLGVEEGEKQWMIVPSDPWAPGGYTIKVAEDLEDLCGNTIIAPFDRPLRQGGHLQSENTATSFRFELE